MKSKGNPVVLGILGLSCIFILGPFILNFFVANLSKPHLVAPKDGKQGVPNWPQGTKE
jgi:hypothetical protein